MENQNQNQNQNRLKLRISRMFRSSFGSCKTRNMPDVIERPRFVPQNGQQQHQQHYQLIELFSPKSRPFPSICRPKCSETTQTELFPRRKISDRNSLLDGRKCPPASPISPLNLNTLNDFQNTESKSIQSKQKLKKKQRKKSKNKATQFMKTNDFDDYYDWFTSDDDDDDKTTLFSSKSLSSDSSDSFRRNKGRYGANRRNRGSKKKGSEEMGLMPLEGKVKNSFAVVKRSSDPYSDFRTSMVEMIVEKQIFGARDLENLLQTFLSLNSYHHHKVIVQVYTEIWEALFSNCS
ncbi:hypothetical protein ACSBR1_005749 [Camellia fascicularis]